MAVISVQEGGGGDYTSLEAAVEAASTVDGDIIEISGAWSAREDTRIAVADALTIRAIGAAKQIGRPWQTGDTHYQHRSTSNSDHSFTITDTGSVIFEDIDIQHAGTGVSSEIFRNNVSNTFIARRCILGFETRTDQQDIYYNENLTTAEFESCHFYNAYRSVCDLYQHDAGSVVNINSCTAYNIGFSTAYNSRSGLVGTYGAYAATVNVFNTIAHIDAGGDNVVMNSDANTTVNMHSVITNTTSLCNTALATDINNVVSATITDSTASSAYILSNLTSGAFDFRLVDHANNLAQDNHSNATGTGTGLSVPSTDLVGTARPQNTNYDLGAFEIAVGGSSSVSNSLQFYWNSLNTVEGSKSYLWGILNNVATQYSVNWDILTSVLNSRSIAWSLVESVQAERSIEWSIYNTVAKTLQIDWNALNSVLNNREVRWSIFNQAVNTLDVDWDVLAALTNVVSTLQTDWALLQSVTKTLGIDWSTLTSVSSGAELRFNVLNQISQALQLEWNLLAEVNQSVQLVWNDEQAAGSVSATLGLSWNTLNKIHNELAAQWELLQAVNVTSDLRWTIAQEVQKTLSANWSLLQNAQNSVSLNWNSLALVNGNVQLNWTIQTDEILIPLHVMVIQNENRVMTVLKEDRIMKIH